MHLAEFDQTMVFEEDIFFRFARRIFFKNNTYIKNKIKDFVNWCFDALTLEFTFTVQVKNLQPISRMFPFSFEKRGW